MIVVVSTCDVILNYITCKNIFHNKKKHEKEFVIEPLISVKEPEPKCCYAQAQNITTGECASDVQSGKIVEILQA